jgi:DNA-binding NtrC family response regulator
MGYRSATSFSNDILFENVLKYYSGLQNPLFFRLVIIDIRMPHINGIQLYQILKILNPSIKILFITSLDAVNELTSILSEVKSTDMIRKPVDAN